jgi:ABC-type molybdate transport system substrate-binding protein
LKLKNPDHTNSAEARNFGENLDCCLCMTPVKTLSFSKYIDVPSGRYTRMRCSKLKYTQQPDHQKVLYFDPNNASFVDMSHKVGYDPESDLYFPKLK